MKHGPVEILPTGTGLRTSPGKNTPNDHVAVGLTLEVTAVGATPSITYVWEGSLDGVAWVPLALITDAADTLSVAAITRTTVGVDHRFIANPIARRYNKIRCRVTANTNVTYRAAMYTS